jgi:hypothetical protein
MGASARNRDGAGGGSSSARLGSLLAGVTPALLLPVAVLLTLAVPLRAFAQDEDTPPGRPRLEYTRGPGACTHEMTL